MKILVLQENLSKALNYVNRAVSNRPNIPILSNCLIEAEKDKLKLLKQHEESKVFSFTRLSTEQTAEIKNVEDDNTSLETNIYAKEKLIETRLNRLENLVKTRKLDNLLGNISEQEKKVK